jgi:hypothetical protein
MDLCTIGYFLKSCKGLVMSDSHTLIWLWQDFGVQGCRFKLCFLIDRV